MILEWLVMISDPSKKHRLDAICGLVTSIRRRANQTLERKRGMVAGQEDTAT